MVRKIPDLPMARIVEVCREYGVSELAVFGSVLRDDFGPDSDVDFLVSFQDNDAGPWMWKLTGLQEELIPIIGRRVDITDKRGLSFSRNSIRKNEILNSAVVIYES